MLFSNKLCVFLFVLVSWPAFFFFSETVPTSIVDFRNSKKGCGGVPQEYALGDPGVSLGESSNFITTKPPRSPQMVVKSKGNPPAISRKIQVGEIFELGQILLLGLILSVTTFLKMKLVTCGPI